MIAIPHNYKIVGLYERNEPHKLSIDLLIATHGFIETSGWLNLRHCFNPLQEMASLSEPTCSASDFPVTQSTFITWPGSRRSHSADSSSFMLQDIPLQLGRWSAHSRRKASDMSGTQVLSQRHILRKESHLFHNSWDRNTGSSSSGQFHGVACTDKPAPSHQQRLDIGSTRDNSSEALPEV